MYSFIKPFLFLLDPETAHDSVKLMGKVFPPSLLRLTTSFKSQRLETAWGNVTFANPIGLAAGFDKNAEIVPFLEALGFGYLEIGSVTAHPCLGNEKPRLFRLPKDLSLINRLGLPNKGVDVISGNLKKLAPTVPLGINIAQTPQLAFGKGQRPGTGIDDYLKTLSQIHPYAAYVVLNLSCPNTEEGTTFEHPSEFEPLAKAVSQARQSLKIQKPILIKLSPDLEKKYLSKTVDLAVKYDFDGFVISNTTPTRPKLNTPQSIIQKMGRGGLSGQALGESANKQLKQVYDMVGRQKTLVGVGGILTLKDVLAKLSAGASFFQIYTGLVYGGPLFVKNLLVGLDQFCKKKGVSHYQQLVGVADLAQEIDEGDRTFQSGIGS